MGKLLTLLLASLGLIGQASAYTDIFNGSGVFDPVAYAAIANDYASADSITFRYGTEQTAGYPGAPTVWQPTPDFVFHPHYNQCDGFDDPGPTIYAQLGGEDCSRNDFGSNMGDVIYRPDDVNNPAVDSLLSLDLSAGVIAEKPQLPWVYGSVAPDPYVYFHSPTPMKPIAMGRCSEHDCAQALVAYQNGHVVGYGSNTASHVTDFQFPAGKVPTAIAITNNSEFALVTIWDTVNIKGQVAVLALGSLADGPSDMSWPRLYPGLRNMSNFTFIKLLGYVDLPTDMKAPTGISAATDFSVMQDMTTQGWLYSATCGPACGAGLAYPQMSPYDSSAKQKSYATPSGTNKDLISRAGVAVVISKAEKKAVFLDLKPLFTKINNTYFQGTLTSFRNTLNNTGQGNSQWPPVFSVSNYAPTIIKEIDLSNDGKPTAVLTSILPNPGHAYIATEDGIIHAWNTAELQAGTSVDPALIVETHAMQVGTNPTSLIHKVNSAEVNAGLGLSNEMIWAVSRGEQKISLVDMVNQTYGLSFQDSRLIDPITVSETQQSPLLTNVLSITDYHGKAVRNYRYHAIDLQGGNEPLHIGMGPTGTDDVEYGGAYDVPGKPFDFTQSNVP